MSVYAPGYVVVKRGFSRTILGSSHPVPQSRSFPSCDTGEIRGLLEVESGVDEPAADALTSDQDCESTVPEGELPNDVVAFNQGFATLSLVPDAPAEADEPAEATTTTE